MNLANKYRPSKFEDVIEQGLPVKLIKGLCDAEPFESRNILLTGPAGTGKANPLYTKIFTPTGFIQMGDIKIGDEVFTHNGSIGIVSGVYPQGKKPIYRIHLSDSTYIDVSDKHINMIYFYDRLQDGRLYCKNVEIETDSLIELFDKSSKDLFIDIPFIEMDEQSTRDVFVDGKSIVELDDKDGKSSIYPYIFTSIRHRLEYLRGVYQTCGSVVSRDCIKITLNQSNLSEEFGILVRSIGYYLDEVIESEDKYHHYIYASNIGVDILSESIYSKVYDEKDKFERHITDIEYIGQEECQCIMVDHEDHSYICDFGLIPTHNTTLARIVGNYLNDGSGDIIEIDAASNNGVEYMRNLIDQARSFPVNCKWKIFILDESHALSSQSWQCLLKPLESGVGKSIFIFATTNPEKIPDTILSRVQSFQLSKISLDGIILRLKYVLDKEREEGRNLSYTEDGVSYIAKLANGGMRDALTMLDKCLTFSKDITIENVCQALNIPEYDQFFDLLSAYAHKDGSAIANIIDSVYNSGTNFVKWFQNFHSFIANIMKYIYLKDISKTMIPTTYLNKVCKYGPAHLSICLNLSMKLLKLNEALRYTQYLQETALSYLAFPIKEGNK